MIQLDFNLWEEEGRPCCYVAPQSKYNFFEFLAKTIEEGEPHFKMGRVREAYVRFAIVKHGDMRYVFTPTPAGAAKVWVRDIREIIY